MKKSEDVFSCTITAPVYQCAEWVLESSNFHEDPWKELSVTAVMTSDDGTVFKVPAFWDGGKVWRVRMTAAVPGKWTVFSECSDTSDTGLHDKKIIFKAGPVNGTNPLFLHGPIRIASGGSYFEHADGTPFLWFGDTWWMLMTERVAWPDGFMHLTATRTRQGFTVVQTVVGYPFNAVDAETGIDANAGGRPWERDYARINPAYFQAADRRLAHIVESGIVPCILGGWGFHSFFMGTEKTHSHWRYLVARYSAWPVIWCLAGEGALPYYSSDNKDGDSIRLKKIWPGIAQTVRAADPWHRPLTLHPRLRSWDDMDDPETLDFHMLQATHMQTALSTGLESLAVGKQRYPEKIIVNGEPPYEGHGGGNCAQIQRYSFWSTMLSGCAGYTYGAAGIYQANDRERPTPVGDRAGCGGHDAVFWDDALAFPGAQQIADGIRLLKSLEFHRFESHPEWVEAKLQWGADSYFPPYRTFAAGIPTECRLAYIPLRWYHWDGPVIRHLEPGIRYRAAYIEPDTMHKHELGDITGDEDGNWQAPILPHLFDWLLLLQRTA